MADDDRIIRFPGAARPGGEGEPPKARGKAGKEPPAPTAPVDPANLAEDQRKALSIVLSGMPFVLVGIKPTESGADFFTALHGEDGDLRNAQPHLAGVIERAYARKGV